MNWYMDDQPDGIEYDIEWLVVRAIYQHYPDDYESFRYRAVLRQPDLARSIVLNNNGQILHYLFRKKIKTLSRAKRFASYLRFTPSDFAAVGLQWFR